MNEGNFLDYLESMSCSKKDVPYKDDMLDALRYVAINGFPTGYILGMPGDPNYKPSPETEETIELVRNYVDEDIEELRKQFYVQFKNPGWITCDEDFKTCNHAWAKYEGFTETYNYCTKCDEKG